MGAAHPPTFARAGNHKDSLLTAQASDLPPTSIACTCERFFAHRLTLPQILPQLPLLPPVPSSSIPALSGKVWHLPILWQMRIVEDKLFYNLRLSTYDSHHHAEISPSTAPCLLPKSSPPPPQLPASSCPPLILSCKAEPVQCPSITAGLIRRCSSMCMSPIMQCAVHCVFCSSNHQ